MSNDPLIRELVLLFFRLRTGDLSAQHLLDEHARIPDRQSLIAICKAAVDKTQNAKTPAPSGAQLVEIRAPCSCGGENENCYKCYGTGTYQKTVVEPRPYEQFVKIKPDSPRVSRSRLGGFAADSRGNSYSIREGGRFDSSPIEDDYGDESSS